MLSQLIVAALLASLAVSAPAASSRKCLPVQYEARILGKVAQDNKGAAQVASFVASVSADYKAKKDVLIESVYFEGKFIGNYTFLRTESATYFIDTGKKTCAKAPPTKVVQICTDTPGLRYITSLSVGSEMADVYSYEADGHKSTTTVLRSSFLPISEIIEQVFAGIPQMVAMQFGNVTMGIKDPSVFDVPSYC